MKQVLFYNHLNKKNIFLPIVFLSFIFQVLAQEHNKNEILTNLNLELFKIEDVNYVVYKKDNSRKPVIIFIRGNGSTPLIIDKTLSGLFPFNPSLISENFHLCVVSKPGIPVFTDSIEYKHINIKKGQVRFVDNNDKIPLEYVKNNNVDSLTKRFVKVIENFNKYDWIDTNNIFVVGHSAGASVAANIPSTCSIVKKVVCMSASPYGRFNEFIRQTRNKELLKTISHKEADSLIFNIYDIYLEVINNRFDNNRYFDSDTYFSWASFTLPSLYDRMLQNNIPTLYVYGSADINRLDADYLKIDILKNNNTNIEIKYYSNYNHNFFERVTNNNGQTEKKYNWNFVMKDITNWLLKK